MPSLIALVEGDGDAEAVPVLLTRVLHYRGRYDWHVRGKQTTKVRSVAALRNRLDNHVAYLRSKAPDAAVVLLDLEDGCPKAEALELADEMRSRGLPFPVAVVLAHREYEAWFLASLATIAPDAADLPDDARFTADPEGPRGCKERLTDMMPSGTTYKETTHQVTYTRLIDLEVAAGRSRSFRRLLHALDELTSGDVRVTPEPR